MLLLLRLVRRQRDDRNDALDAVVVGLRVVRIVVRPDLVVVHVGGLVVRVQVVGLRVEDLEALHPRGSRGIWLPRFGDFRAVPAAGDPDAADATPPDDAHVLAQQQRAQVGPVAGRLLLREERVVADDGVLEPGRWDSLPHASDPGMVLQDSHWKFIVSEFLRPNNFTGWLFTLFPTSH